MNKDIEAKKTVYKDTLFRSMLEVRWAIFFDRLGVEWAYEPELFTCGDLQYLPDFWLPSYQSFVEIKPTFDFDGFDKCEAFAKEGKPIVVLYGPLNARGVGAWVGVSGKLIHVPLCQFGICLKCEAPVLCVPIVGKQDSFRWEVLLAPKSMKATPNHQLHRVVKYPFKVGEHDDWAEAKAKFLLMSAYEHALNARNVCRIVYDDAPRMIHAADL